MHTGVTTVVSSQLLAEEGIATAHFCVGADVCRLVSVFTTCSSTKQNSAQAALQKHCEHELNAGSLNFNKGALLMCLPSAVGLIRR